MYHKQILEMIYGKVKNMQIIHTLIDRQIHEKLCGVQSHLTPYLIQKQIDRKMYEQNNIYEQKCYLNGNAYRQINRYTIYQNFTCSTISNFKAVQLFKYFAFDEQR